MVRILIERYCHPNKELELESLLINLRAKVMRQHGYISGETIRDMDDPLHWVTISTWTDADLWKVWETSHERQKITSKIESLLVRPEKMTIFTFAKRALAAYAHTIDT
ncbi:antibiotic biosynthesis monooxygenase family protein [Chloroflexota bacterium]